MRRLVLFTARLPIGYLLLMLLSPGAYAQNCTTTTIQHILLSYRISGQALVVDGESIHFPEQLTLFYESIGFEPVWTTATANDMITAASNAWREGLLPEDYHIESLIKYAGIRSRTEYMDATYDLLLTDSFFTFALHLWNGKANPEELFPEKWERPSRDLDVQELLRSAIRGENLTDVFNKLRPTQPGYQDLVERLQVCRGAPSHDPLAGGQDIKVNTRDERIHQIRERLGLATRADSTLYDSALFQAVRKFQNARGLPPDGVIGKQTLDALNESPEILVGRIKVNLERYRWLQRDSAGIYVVVNIPDFSLRLVERNLVLLTMRVIVGRPDRSTPVFSSTIRYLELNPTWTVPPTILKEDVLPAVSQNVNYLKLHNLKVIDRSGMEIAPDSLPWSSYTIKNFPYQLRQQPGPENSMGTIKFLFPNRYRVFLHDTNAPRLFLQSNRALSSGCIRIEKPVELASHLLASRRWSVERLRKEIETGKTRTLVFPHPVPFYLHYFTVFVEEGELQQRPDIYEVDAIVLKTILTPLN